MSWPPPGSARWPCAALSGHRQTQSPGRGAAFDIKAAYTPDSPLPPGFDSQLGRFDVKPPAGGPVKLKLKLRLNLNCCAGLESAQYVTEEEYEERVPRAAPAAAPAAKARCLACPCCALALLQMFS